MEISATLRWVLNTGRRAILIVIMVALLGGSVIAIETPQAQTRIFTRPVEFNFLNWTLSAVFSKLGQWSLGSTNYLVEPERTELVKTYLEDLGETQRLQRQLEELYGTPDKDDLEEAIQNVHAELEAIQTKVSRSRPVVETILQEDVGMLLQEMDFDIAGAPFPPVLMQFTPLPSALIVSPRDEIRQEANITLKVGLSIEEQIQLEDRVESAMGVSALVVPIGGMGTYPTMIQQSTTLSWVTEVIAHEWTHNYLSLHPLGFNYSTTPELRTINETVASLIGVDFSRRVLGAKYPEYLPPDQLDVPAETQPELPAEDVFDFRAEMRETRLKVDELLAQGEIEVAEEYMEARRVFFWEQGYRIRKLNQAYFAFHGAYADEPGGAAGDDPVGGAVRTLWQEINSPRDFLRRVAGISSYEALQAMLREELTTR
ncbi:MAG: hypothetical protein PVF18_03745 [Anaerolineales bacterium]|jgi:hypothetical protein